MGRQPLDLSSGFKFCPQCSQNLPLSEYSKSSSTQHGYQSFCKACMYRRHKLWCARPGNKEKMAARLRKERAKDPERFRDYDLRSRMKLKPGTYQEMYARQNGKCAICERPNGGQRGKYRFHVDHCHDSGTIRGLLCHNCNVGIGNLKHSEKLMLKAVEYLRRYPITQT